jgi:hypothetical protein
MARAIYTPHKQDRAGKIDMLVPGISGLVLNKKPDEVSDTDLVASVNTVYDQVGAVETAPGTTKLLTTSLGSGITGMHPFYYDASTIKQLHYSSGSNLYRYDNAGGSTAVSSTVSSNRSWQYATSKGKVFACDGSGGIYSCTGLSNYVLVTATYKPIGMKFYKNRLYIFEANSSLLRFSNAGDPTTFPPDNFIEFNTDDGQVITGLDEDIDSLTVHKSESVWYMTGEPMGVGSDTTRGNLQLHKANSQVGTCAQRTMTKIARGISIFAAYDGIYVFQNFRSDNVSADIEPIFKTDMNPNYLHLMWGVYNRTEKKYLLGYPSAGATTCDKVIMLDLADLGDIKYAIWDDMPGSCAVNFKFQAGRDVTLIGHPTKGYIYQAFFGYSRISSGDYGFATAAASTTLTDSGKAWTTNQHRDARVNIVSGTGHGQSGIVASNTATQLTMETPWATVPDVTSVYTIGGYHSYVDTKLYDMGRPAMSKKMKFLSVFMDAKGLQDLLVAAAYEQAAIGDYTDKLSMAGGGLIWGQIDPDTGVRMKWGKAGKKWGRQQKVDRTLALSGAQSTHIQYRLGSYYPNQPFRITKHVTTYVEKRNRQN